MFGGLAFGSALWGQVAAMTELPLAHFAAAAGAILAIPVLWRWKLQTGAGVDLTPSMHWPEPVLACVVAVTSTADASTFATPKSRTQAPRSVSIMFEGFRSR